MIVHIVYPPPPHIATPTPTHQRAPHLPLPTVKHRSFPGGGGRERDFRSITLPLLDEPPSGTVATKITQHLTPSLCVSYHEMFLSICASPLDL